MVLHKARSWFVFRVRAVRGSTKKPCAFHQQCQEEVFVFTPLFTTSVRGTSHTQNTTTSSPMPPASQNATSNPSAFASLICFRRPDLLSPRTPRLAAAQVGGAGEARQRGAHVETRCVGRCGGSESNPTQALRCGPAIEIHSAQLGVLHYKTRFQHGC